MILTWHPAVRPHAVSRKEQESFKKKLLRKGTNSIRSLLKKKQTKNKLSNKKNEHRNKANEMKNEYRNKQANKV